MTNGITYYKLKSPYMGDVTKNCALTGPEVDNNFFTLEGRDLKSITVEGNDIVLNLMNGDSLKAQDAFDNFIVNVEFNSKEGSLKVYRNNGDVEELKGFATSWNVPEGGLSSVAVNSTLNGNGLKSAPIGIAESYKTGQYKPVDEFIEKRYDCVCTNPRYVQPHVGDRFIVEEQVSDFGLLYDYRSVMQIACDLQRANSEWRIPTKEDWDDMLNAVEPRDCDRNHGVATPNKFLGEWAGKVLKSEDKWIDVHHDHCHHDHHEHHPQHPHFPEHGGFDKPHFMNDEPCANQNVCEPTYCGEPEPLHCHDDNFTRGIDKYGFCVMPSGYADDGFNSLFFGERGGFWTASNIKMTNAYIKRFDYNKNGVYQNIVPCQDFYSLRLVKDYKGDNFRDSEEILGQSYPTVLMPSVTKGSAIWTSVNIYITRKHYKTLVPNNGIGLSFTKKYFIDEWDGKTWLRNELKEGDSVVIKKAPHRQSNVEYRVINGDLVNTTTKIIEQVYDKVNVKLEHLNNLIAEETARSTAKDNEHDEKLTELDNRTNDIITDVNEINEHLNTVDNRLDKLDDDIVKVNERIDTEVERLDAADEKLTEELNKTNQVLTDFGKETGKAFEIINNVLKTSIDNINNAILTEKQERVEKDNEHDELIKSLDEKVETVTTEIKEDIANFKKETAEHFESLEKVDEEINNHLNEVEGQLIVAEGTSYNEETGILTLAHKDNENNENIEVQFKFGNFGTF